jgi:hypothetical protein
MAIKSERLRALRESLPPPPGQRAKLIGLIAAALIIGVIIWVGGVLFGSRLLGPTGVPVSQPTAPVSQASITVVSNAQHVDDSMLETATTLPCADGEPLVGFQVDCGLAVTAACPAGESLLGGGFSVAVADPSYAHVSASYPSSAHAWTAIVHDEGNGPDAGGVALTLTTYAYCLPASSRLSPQIVQAPAAIPRPVNGSSRALGAAACPAGTAVTGGGFRGSVADSVTSKPAGNGWKAILDVLIAGDVAPVTPTVFALCARANVAPESGAAAVGTIQAGQHASVSAQCPSGHVLIGGGYSQDGGGNVYGAMAASDGTQWLIEVAGPIPDPTYPNSADNVAVYGICVTGS